MVASRASLAVCVCSAKRIKCYQLVENTCEVLMPPHRRTWTRATSTTAFLTCVNDANDDEKDEWIVPSLIYDGKCSMKTDKGPNQIDFTWKAPLNLAFIPHEKLNYEILVQAFTHDTSEGHDVLGEFSTTEPYLSVSAVNMKKYRSIQASVISVLDYDLRSGEAAILCDLELDQF